MEKLRVNDTPVRTARNFLINNIEIELEMPEKIAEFKNVEIINEKSTIDSKVSNLPLTYGNGKILEELNKNNTAPAEVWNVIEKGASLIGTVKYSMEKRQSDGWDKPEFLDCSAFSAWAFHKAGVTSVPYGSTTATFIGSKKFQDISADQLQPGDIGLKSKTGGTGGANHVGIYCGKMKDGREV